MKLKFIQCQSQVKKDDDNDIMNVLRAISRDINEVKSNFTEQNVKLNELNSRFDVNDSKFDEQNIKLYYI